MAKKVTKFDLIDKIYENFDFKRSDIAILTDAFFNELKNFIVAGNIIEIRGFGTFEVKIRKGKKNARNPKTGETFPIEDHGVVGFRPGKEIKSSVWNLEK